VKVKVTIVPERAKVWPEAVIFFEPSADASAWKFAVVPSTRLVPLNEAFCTIVVI
jgi:hypothetical protein